MRVALLVTLLALLAGAARGEEAARPAPPCVLRASLQGIVTSTSATYLAGALRATEAQGCVALLILVDTPGGNFEATRTIVQALLNARVPVLAYVAPSGARAGSAGALITLAAHVAAMAPGTTIGAAHPVTRRGQDPERAIGKQLSRKLLNDAAALARAIAEARGRNVTWAEAAVRESVSATAREALALHVINVVARSTGELLEEVAGSSVTLPQGRARLEVGAATLRPFAMSISERTRSLLSQPTLAYLLLLLGLLGIVIELASPGLIVPGVIGAIALLLAALGLEALPVTLAGILLIVVGVGLFMLELFVTSYGVLTLGGMIALLLGSVLLLDRASPSFFADASVRLSWGAVFPLIALFTAAAAAVAWQARQSRRRKSPTGREGLLGATGRTLTEVTAERGLVRLHGEQWQATAEAPIPAGKRIQVVDVRGLSLRVRPA